MNQDDRLFYALEIARAPEKPFDSKNGLNIRCRNQKERLTMIRRLLDPKTDEAWLDDNLSWIQQMIPRKIILEHGRTTQSPVG